MITLPQAQYFAYKLTQRHPSNSLEKFSETLLDAKVELNPHQVEAALFAFRSPLSGGAILADEVGLGKTIEAGILLSQSWAEGKRKILILCPSSLRKQWANELMEKFYLPSVILESKTYKEHILNKRGSPFDQDKIIIASYHFAKNKAEDLQNINWDLVTIDEAHRLRNAYKESNVIGNTLMLALEGKPKILLTATPLQNSIMELFGLISFIDPMTFGDKNSFKRQFSYAGQVNYPDLRDRLKPILHRTLRRQINYLKFTNRHPLTFQFEPTKEEQKLYEEINNYLLREELFALPRSQRHLLTLIMRKLLASSSFAITRTLKSLIRRLENLLKNEVYTKTFDDEIDEDYESFDEYLDEEGIEEIQLNEDWDEKDVEKLKEEIADLKEYVSIAENIQNNAKGKKLLVALEKGFAELNKAGAPEKALIFTESTRTQTYLYNLLNAREAYKDKVVLFNGSNNDPGSREIYQNWLLKHKGTDVDTGNKKIDTRQAIVDCFQSEAKIMIATEAAAEGINLQFCAMVVNYDLPWNPQRIEQRIGRCHRYGQKNDVVVVNFLNVRNQADQRVHQLLDQKFNLFRGVFGASDEVLGTIESGVDFEKKIAKIYQNCRTKGEINQAFDELERQIEENKELNAKFENARQDLFENFDAQVINKLKVTDRETRFFLDKHEKWLWELTKYALSEDADFNDGEYQFNLHNKQNGKISPGKYALLKELPGCTRYRMRHPLAQNIITEFKNKVVPQGHISFIYSNSGQNISILEPFKGKSGLIRCALHTIHSFETVDHLIAVATIDDQCLSQEAVEWLLTLSATYNIKRIKSNISLETMVNDRKQDFIEKIKQKDKQNFIEETNKLTKWAEDKERELDKQLDDVKAKIRNLQNEKAIVEDELDMINLEQKIQKQTRKKNKLRREILDLSDEILEDRDEIIENLKNKMQREEILNDLFTLTFDIK
ncbi:SNF2-related protein [Membranihabitans maritimus]|uniref:SNF2-related protein n=1 Tax=Membranihabitans maritimus TaxID=2904244 RepID=UPI001F01BA1A|nr:SNF2-related protein [Membranihabitans maritimus]